MQIVRYHTPRSTRTYQLPIAAATGPLEAIAGKRILVLADDENLSHSAKDLGYKLSYTTLGSQLRQTSRACLLHAIFSRPPGDGHRAAYFTLAGWTAHPRDIQIVQTRNGIKQEANADDFILFTAGRLASRTKAEVIVIGSGDGNLVCALTQALATLPTPRQVVTMSLAGSTSQRLDATRHHGIAANIEIGRDCLHPMGGR